MIVWNDIDAENALTKAGYDPAEPRDDLGRWTDGGSNGGENSNDTDAFLQTGIRDGSLNDGVYHPGVDVVDLEDAAGSPEQLRLNRLVHDAR